jgi:catechol-2,3-dioxygenase
MEAKRWSLRRVGLKILDLPAEIAYYEKLGLRLLEADDGHALLGFEEEPVLELRLLPGGPRRRRRP